MSAAGKNVATVTAPIDVSRLCAAFEEAELSLESWEAVADLETPHDRLVYVKEPCGAVSVEVFIARNRPDMDYDAFKWWCRNDHFGPLDWHDDDFVSLYREYVEDWVGRARIEADWLEGNILDDLTEVAAALGDLGYEFEQVHDHRHRIRVTAEPKPIQTADGGPS